MSQHNESQKTVEDNCQPRTVPQRNFLSYFFITGKKEIPCTGQHSFASLQIRIIFCLSVIYNVQLCEIAHLAVKG